MKLSIYNLKGELFAGEISSVNLKTALGEITVLAHHRPLVTVVLPGEINISRAGGTGEKINTNGGGFLEVDGNNEAVIILD